VTTLKHAALIDSSTTADLGTAPLGLTVSFLLLVVIAILPF
jgi:hypothetical protein